MLLDERGKNMNMRLSTAVAAAGIALALAMAPAGAASGADARFKTIYTKEWKWRVAEQLARGEGERGVSPSFARVDAAA
jgi:hypothetical protein